MFTKNQINLTNFKKHPLLFLRRIQPITIHPEFHTNISMLRDYLSLRIHPKEVVKR